MVFAKKLKIVVTIVFFLFMFMPIAQADQPLIILGQNNPSADIQTVQTAVDQGGTILLKGTFDFGDKGRVNIRKDVKIVGETDDKGNPLTKIKGGSWTFHSPLPAQLPPEAPGPKITIQNIHFDGALWCPIHLAYSSGAAILANKITNVRPIPRPFPIFGKEGLNAQQGIICSPRYAQPTAPPKFQPGAFTGTLTIADNEIDMLNEDPVKTMAQGVLVIWTTGVTAQILRNTIYNCTRNSIETIDNYLGKDGSGMIVIHENKIVTPQSGVPVPNPFTPNGILLGWFVDLTGAVDPKRNIKYVATNNAIRTRGKTSLGIMVFSDGAVINNNAILTESPGGRGLFICSSSGYIAYNKFEGTSVHALQIRPWPPLVASHNLFVNNDFSLFRTSAADVLFDKESNNNLVFGTNGTVSDLGSGNQITGLKPVIK